MGLTTTSPVRRVLQLPPPPPPGGILQKFGLLPRLSIPLQMILRHEGHAESLQDRRSYTLEDLKFKEPSIPLMGGCRFITSSFCHTSWETTRETIEEQCGNCKCFPPAYKRYSTPLFTAVCIAKCVSARIASQVAFMNTKSM
jgi:hypothetical protein